MNMTTINQNVSASIQKALMFTGIKTKVLLPKEKREDKSYLTQTSQTTDVEALVTALQHDNYSVRWMASESLIRLGNSATEAILNALVDPARVADPRLRDGVYRILQHTLPKAIHPYHPLIKALRGPAPDICTMRAANEFLINLAH